MSEQRRQDVLSLLDHYEKRLAKLRIATLPATAEVFVDGELQPDSSRIEVDPGRHVITARLGDHAEASVIVELAAADERTLTLELGAPPSSVARPPPGPPAPRPLPAPRGARPVYFV